MGWRRVECARCKVIGGSSSINAMVSVRGNRGDYDRWAESGLTTWSYAHVLPYFRRQESWEDGAGSYRGGDGPLTTERSRFQDPLIEALAAAGAAAGHPVTEDYNGAQQEGFGTPQMTIRDGRRCSAAVAYLRPALERPNLKVEINALADRIVREIAKARLRGRGIAASQPHGVMAFLKTAPDLPMPDIQLLCSAAPLTAAPYFRPFVAPYEDSFACRAVLLRPESRGQVTLTSRDPKQAPRIRQNFLARENDWVTLRAGVQLARDIGRQAPLARFVASEIGPGLGCRSVGQVGPY